MPYVTLPEDQIHLYYRTNLPNDDLTVIATSGKETILYLHPTFLSSVHLSPQFDDPLLNDNFNLIAFDALACGRTEAQSYLSLHQAAVHDGYVDAAIIALFHEYLGLPPVHVMAGENRPVQAAMGFAMLFPEKTLSLIACSPPRVDMDASEWVRRAWGSLADAWSKCNDLDALDSVFSELLYISFASTLDEDEADEIVDYWYRFYPPAHITRTIALRIIINNHKRISCLECSWFTQPVMIIQGSNKYQPGLFPVLEQNFIESLSHVPGGVQVVTVEDASYCLAIPRKTAPKVNSAIANFIKNLDRTQRPSFSLPTDRAERFRLALEKIAQLEPNSDMGSRNPLSAFSYSRVTPTKAKANYEAIILPQMEIEKHGFDPVTPNGAIIRPYSERSSSYDHRPRAPSVVSLTEEISVTEE